MKIKYDAIAKIYDRVRVGDSIIIDRILRNMEIEETSRILDIGCGTGNNTVLLEKVTEAELYGMDASEGMLKKAQKKSHKITFLKGDAVRMDIFEEDFFHAVFMVDVIHHIRDLNKMMKGLFRILKQGGRVFIFTDSHDHIKNNRLVSRYFPETIEPELIRYPSTKAIVDTMNKNDFHSISTEEIQYPAQEKSGEKLIELAETKGFSMFHLISQEAIDRGINRLRQDLKNKGIVYYPKTEMVIGIK